MTYNYNCPMHGLHTITASIHDNLKENPPTCLTCGSIMARIYTSPPITFKGTGWAGKQ